MSANSQRGRGLQLLIGDRQLLFAVAECGGLPLQGVQPEAVLCGHRVQQQQREQSTG